MIRGATRPLPRARPGEDELEVAPPLAVGAAELPSQGLDAGCGLGQFARRRLKLQFDKLAQARHTVECDLDLRAPPRHPRRPPPLRHLLDGAKPERFEQLTPAVEGGLAAPRAAGQGWHLGQAEFEFPSGLHGRIDPGALPGDRDEVAHPSEPQRLIGAGEVAAGMSKVAIDLVDRLAKPGRQGHEPGFEDGGFGDPIFLLDFVHWFRAREVRNPPPMIPSPRTASGPTRLVIALAVMAVAGCGEPPRHPAVGLALRGLPITSVSDPTLRPPSLSERVTLLNFWGTWCPPCRRELPGLVRIAEGLAADGRFQFVPVSIGAGGDDGELAAETRRFLAAQRLDLDAWLFSDALAGMMFSESVGLSSLPTTYLIGPDARIRRVWNGYRPSDEAEIAAAIVGLLKEVRE